MNNYRRIIIKGSLSAGIAGIAAGTGLLTPQFVLADWPKAAFEATTVADALKDLGGEGDASSEIKIKAPDIAENGAVVPITVSTSLSDVTKITILADKNGTPLTSSYEIAPGTEPYISTRIKMGETANVVAIVTSGGKTYSAKKEVKVTIGGCGG